MLATTQQVDELLPVDVVLGQAQVQVFLIIRTIGAQDVQSLATAAHPHQQPLPQQQPAGVDQIQSPDRVTGVHEIATRVPRFLAPRPCLLLLILADEFLLFVRIGFPQEASYLVVGNADAFQQILHAAGGVENPEFLLEPVADLVRVTKATTGDFGFQLFHLVRGQFARVAFVVQGAQGVEPPVTIDGPFAQLRQTDTQQFSDFFSGITSGYGQDGCQALVNRRSSVSLRRRSISLRCSEVRIIGFIVPTYRGRWVGLANLATKDYSCIVGVGSPSATVYDDGQVTYNVEATQIGRLPRRFQERPGRLSDPGASVAAQAVKCGSDLRALTPREMLGVFVGLRGRHMRNIDNLAEAQKDFLLARYLFPTSRRLYFLGTWLSIQQSVHLFEEGEEGPPQNLAEVIKSSFGSWQSPIGRFANGPIEVGYNLGKGRKGTEGTDQASAGQPRRNDQRFLHGDSTRHSENTPIVGEDNRNGRFHAAVRDTDPFGRPPSRGLWRGHESEPGAGGWDDRLLVSDGQRGVGIAMCS